MKHALRMVATTALVALAPALPASHANAQEAVAAEIPALALDLVVDGLTAPIELVSSPDDTGRRFIVEQTGVVHVLGADGRLSDVPFLDIRDRMLPLRQDFEERGLLGFAFHPDFAENGRLFVTYSAPLRVDAPEGWNHTRIVSEFTVSPDEPDRVDPASERVLIALDWPSRKHNGGGLGFGGDGYLYIGMGDGGGVHGVGAETLFEAFDTPYHLLEWDQLAQDPESLYGKILRIDVDRGHPGYGIPPLNPFVGIPGRDEIYAWGFRNPFRFSVDGNALFTTAVGETLWESIYLIDRPGNYGWPIREGTHCFDRTQPMVPPETCASTGAFGEWLIDPIIEYPNMSVGREGVPFELAGVGTAVVGGHVYRGSAIPGLEGMFVFGDWSSAFDRPSGQVFVATPSARFGDLWPIERVLEVPGRIQSLGRDGDGEIYILTNDEFGPFGTSGKVFQLVAQP